MILQASFLFSCIPHAEANGMYFDVKGNLISCADEHDELISISPDKKITVLINNYNGHILNGPNDVWINRLTGGIYITDPYFQRDYWTRQQADSNLHGEKLILFTARKKRIDNGRQYILLNQMAL